MAVPALALAPSTLPLAAALPGLTAALDASAAAHNVEFEALLAAQLGLDPAALEASVGVEPAVVAEPDAEGNAPLQSPTPAPQAETGPLDPLTAALVAIPAAVPVPVLVAAPAPAQPLQSAAPPEVPAALPGLTRQPAQLALADAMQDARDAAAPATSTAEVAAAPATIAGLLDQKPQLPGQADDTPAGAGPADGLGQADSRSAAHPVAPERAHEAARRIDHPSTDVPVRVGARSFADDVGQRVMWMASNARQAAELRLDPPHLGPVEVRLTLSGDQATLTLLSPHASVREALQSSLPRLQEMLVSAGIDLGSVHVGSHAPGGDTAHGAWRGAGEHPGTGWLTQSSAPLSAATPALTLGRGLIDTYA